MCWGPSPQPWASSFRERFQGCWWASQHSAARAAFIIQQQVNRLIFLGRNSWVLGVLLTVKSLIVIAEAQAPRAGSGEFPCSCPRALLCGGLTPESGREIPAGIHVRAVGPYMSTLSSRGRFLLFPSESGVTFWPL